MPKTQNQWFYLTSEHKKLLEKLSDRTGAPVAEPIRRAIDHYFKVSPIGGPRHWGTLKYPG